MWKLKDVAKAIGVAIAVQVVTLRGSVAGASG